MADLFTPLPADLSELSVEDLESWISAARETAKGVAADPDSFVSESRNTGALMDEMTEGVAAIERVNAELAKRRATADDDTVEAEVEDAASLDDESRTKLAAMAAEFEAEPEAEVVPEVEAEVVEPEAVEAEVETVEAEAVEEAEAVVAAAKPARMTIAKPSRSRAAAPVVEAPEVALTAAAENLGFSLGQKIPTEDDLARMMIDRRRLFGNIPEGTHGEQIPIGRADWSDLYTDERILSDSDVASNMKKIEAAVDPEIIAANMEKRKEAGGSLVASGGLCAPVTPYYQLQMLSTATRPVRAALPSFNADRGGIKAARPAALTSIGSAVGLITMAQDLAGGSPAQKTCQVIDCPPFTETDVVAIYHCLQFGNIGARTFPELVAQWNNLVLAAHARKSETALLDGMLAASTKVTAQDLGLGASASFPGQVIAAGDAMRSRHRMDTTAVLRAMLPWWILDVLTSDVYRSQFDRFEMGPSDFVALLRKHNIEPSFYMDSPTGKGQVFGTQSAGALLTFPHTATWFLFPEGSFLYLDGGTLELGLVRDSTLNKTNDFQIFGETWENVAFIGVESLAIDSELVDTGEVSQPADIAHEYAY